uniref:SEC7 domain-containing protein n=1 Tax=Chromera velia CCMP2878 TaxID=1169474 RepID=A0A0G4G318_9ALVE|eukprot:Cvel_19881.t1-p1 / transcript=Cvel_19881.t1 / gene=Cvel_19881 / organism=Chromera_velia_CCMP2878 / gene_product=Brefeldin A-inhibited guanine nucleotide-exchange, putative / transcript_product=Brefeldin A-inhibited guanine nucleotide-exchange, putative / location=Cvel_scaffold1744:11908-27163(-) / protein_length=2318 / sequence_SO=supercontig / SO=protein_coding / is_pseudo=false
MNTPGFTLSPDDPFFFKSLKLGCEAGVAKVQIYALECIQTLLAHEYLHGRTPDLFRENKAGQPPRLLMDSLVETVCAVNDNGGAETEAQLQIIRCLLTAVTSNSSKVHGPSLMLAVRTIFTIHRDSRDATNQRTAQAALTQMLNVVVQRMEFVPAVDAHLNSGHVALAAEQAEASRRAGASGGSVSGVGDGQTSAPSAVGAGGVPAATGGSHGAPPDMETKVEAARAFAESLVWKLTDDVCKAKFKEEWDAERGGEEETEVPPPDFSTLLNEHGHPCGKFGWCVVCRSTAHHFCIQTRDPVCGRPCKAVNLQRLEIMDAPPAPAPGEGGEDSSAPRQVGDNNTTEAGAPAGGETETAGAPVGGEGDGETVHLSEDAPGKLSSNLAAVAAAVGVEDDNSVWNDAATAQGEGMTSGGLTLKGPAATGSESARANGTLSEAAAAVIRTLPNRAPTPVPVSGAASAAGGGAGTSSRGGMLTLQQKDALTLFQSLCKLSMKDIPPGSPPDQRSVRSKKLALELIQSMLQNSGPLLRNSEKFIEILKMLLCISLIKNCVSHIPRIFELSLGIFLLLFGNFKDHLRNEIGVFVEQIFLRILESGNSSFQHKHRVLEVFYKLFTDASIALELFLNFDCDVDEKDIFARSLDCLAKIAQGKYTQSEHTNLISLPNQQQALRNQALKTLVTLMGSVIEWAGLDGRAPAQGGGGGGVQLPSGAASSPAPTGSQGDEREGHAGGEGRNLKDSAEGEEGDSEGEGGEGSPGRRRSSAVGGGKPGSPTGTLTSFRSAPLNATEGPTTLSSSSAPQLVAASSPAPSSSGQGRIERQRAMKSSLQRGIAKFNMKPKKGIEFLLQNGHIVPCAAPERPEGAEGVVEEEEEVEEASLARGIAQFLLKQEGLDKTQMGDYLGEDKPMNKRVLYALVDALNFQSLELDSAIRKFLAAFRLPGEAQKIDRMMEKFAEKYCRDNPGRFNSADVCYVLSFALIMLHTDAHSKEIKPERKMTKNDFCSNNRGIDDGKDLPREYLEELYDRVVAEEWVMEDDQAQMDKMESAQAAARRKFELFMKETQGIINKSTQMIKRKDKKTRGYIVANRGDHLEYVKFLFETASWPLLATFSVLLETEDNNEVALFCLEGVKRCIVIAGRLRLDTERESFVGALSRLTNLHSSTAREAKERNIEAIKHLIWLGLHEGDFLMESWRDVLSCVSHLDRLQIVNLQGSGVAHVVSMGAESRRAHGGDGGHGAGGHGAAHEKEFRAVGQGVLAPVTVDHESRLLEEINSQSVLSSIDPSQIDRLFNQSVRLDNQAIVTFVSSLCEVSKEEMASPTQPRIFSLQKIVEVADYNMNRLRLVWTRIWGVIRERFAEVAVHPNVRIAMYAIDSLKQLTVKFLQKGELSNFHFQSEFLRPFEKVMGSPAPSPEVKDMVLAILSAIVRDDKTRKGIKSGWRVVLQICDLGAREVNVKLVEQSFAIVEWMWDAEDVFPFLLVLWSEAVKCLSLFGSANGPLEVSRKAVELLERAGKFLGQHGAVAVAESVAHQGAVPAGGGASGTVSAGQTPSAVDRVGMGGLPRVVPLSAASPTGAAAGGGTTSAAAAVAIASGAAATAAPSGPSAYWFPVLASLAQLISDKRKDVRTLAMRALFGLLGDYGGEQFDKETWRMIFRGVLFPLFDDIHHSQESVSMRIIPTHTPSQSASAGGGGGGDSTTRVPSEAGTEAGAPRVQAAGRGPVLRSSSAVGYQGLQMVMKMALEALVGLIDKHFDSISFLFPDVLTLLVSFIEGSEHASPQDDFSPRAGRDGLRQLIALTGKRCGEESWRLIASKIMDLFRRTVPFELLNFSSAHEAWHESAPFFSNPSASSSSSSEVAGGGGGAASVSASPPPTSVHPLPSPSAASVDEKQNGEGRQILEEEEDGGATEATGPTEGEASSSSSSSSADKQKEKGAGDSWRIVRSGGGRGGEGANGAEGGGMERRDSRSGSFSSGGKDSKGLDFDVQLVVHKSVVQLLLIELVRDITPSHIAFMPLETVGLLLDSLKGAFDFAWKFNSEIERRRTLKMKGFMSQLKQLPVLLKQERESLMAILSIQFALLQSALLERGAPPPPPPPQSPGATSATGRDRPSPSPSPSKVYADRDRHAEANGHTRTEPPEEKEEETEGANGTAVSASLAKNPDKFSVSDEAFAQIVRRLSNFCRWVVMQYVRKTIRVLEYREQLGPPPETREKTNAILSLEEHVQIETEREVQGLSVVVESGILGAFMQLPWPEAGEDGRGNGVNAVTKMRNHEMICAGLFPLLTELVLAESKPVRRIVQQLLATRIGASLRRGLDLSGSS